MIKADKLSFFYGKKQVLKDISLEFEQGKLYVIVGTNGSGKTTLLHALARLHKAKGSLALDGEAYENISKREFAKKLAILPQERIIPDMSVFDFVSAGRYPYLDISRRLTDSDTDAVKCAMKKTGTEGFANINLKKLSGGERQRAYIAMLMAQDTPYVLLDEPTSHLDISHAFEVMELLSEMRNDAKCVVAVLHDLSLALKYADEITVLQNGEIKTRGTPSDIAQSGYIESVFGVKYTGKSSFEFIEKNVKTEGF